ncbi:MAG: amidohydrolase/deacetylase family metallohydrolase [Chloroflexi bacterium]|jgi:dihydroorotase|nr:amidohydrolase/deacetylase family metallohydrolase [Chloroflexota bacterium]
MANCQNEAATERYDLVLQGGHVIDPKNNISEPMDVAVRDRRIAAVGKNLSTTNAKQVVNVSGLYVTPGLIDMHVHVFSDGQFNGSVVADGQAFSGGVTTMVDAGTPGALNFGLFKERVVETSRTRVLAYLNIVDKGMGPHDHDVPRMDVKACAGVVKAFPDLIVGVKTAHYWTRDPWDEAHQPWDSVDRAVEAGVLADKPVMVDFWPRPPERSYEDLILKHLRPGDIHTHVFAQQFPIVDAQGKLNPALWEARERGIIFDVGHGAGSFWFRNAIPAFKEGFVPDSMSTDLHTGTAATGTVGNVLNVMSKFMNIGCTLEDVVMRTTVAPAREIGRPELGTLDVGADADIAVLKLNHGDFGFIDSGGAKMLGNQRLTCMLTVRNGGIAFDAEGISKPEWEKAPASYWVCP